MALEGPWRDKALSRTGITDREEAERKTRKRGPGNRNRRHGAPRGAASVATEAAPARCELVTVAPCGAPSPRVEGKEEEGLPGADSKNTGDDARLLYPPLEGEGRLPSVAKAVGVG